MKYQMVYPQRGGFLIILEVNNETSCGCLAGCSVRNNPYASLATLQLGLLQGLSPPYLISGVIGKPPTLYQTPCHQPNA